MRKPLFLLTCLCLCLCLSAPAWADPAMECEAPSQVEIGECVSAVLTRVDGAIATSLGFARAGMADLDQVTGREVAVPALERSQSAWEAYRDAHCETIGASYGGGSGTGIAITSCRIELGRDRASELLGLAK